MISVQGKFLCNNITEGFTFSGTIEIQNLKGEQSIGKKNGKCR